VSQLVSETGEFLAGNFIAIRSARSAPCVRDLAGRPHSSPITRYSYGSVITHRDTSVGKIVIKFARGSVASPHESLASTAVFACDGTVTKPLHLYDDSLRKDGGTS